MLFNFWTLSVTSNNVAYAVGVRLSEFDWQDQKKSHTADRMEKYRTNQYILEETRESIERVEFTKPSPEKIR